MQYRVSFLLDALSTGIVSGVYFLSLVLVLDRFGSISGWKLAEIAFLAGMVEMGFATMDLFFSGFDPDWFSPIVRMGTFDQYLLRPVNITLQMLGSRFVIRRLGRIVEGLVIFSLALLALDIQWNVWKVLYLPVVLVSQVVSYGALFIIGSTITFWTLQSIEAVNILTYGGTEMTTYPMNIYPGWIQKFFTYVIPLIFMNFYPALFFLNKPDPLGFPEFAPFLAPFLALLLLAVALWFWGFGIRHYQGAGS